MNSFNEIYVLDLHGNNLKKERCPDGSKDENVFDIRQGVAISLFIKKEGLEKKVFHSECWGLREDKYNWLSENDIGTTNWQEIKPKPEFYLFIPRDEALLEAYNRYRKVTEVFPVNSVGIVTARDNLTIKRTPEEVRVTILNFSKMDSELARVAYNLGKDVRDWKVELAQKDLINSGLSESRIVPLLYRPFDVRYTYYTGKSRGFHCMPRPEVMRHMMKENLGLITVRQVAEGVFNHAFVANAMVESRITLSNKGIGYLFPLYLYLDKGDIFSYGEAQERKPNLNPKLLESLAQAYGKGPTPEEIFHYSYGVLYSNIYRTKYAEFLKIDFPRVPFTRNYELFSTIGKYGSKLINLHLMKAAELSNPIVKFQGGGDYGVRKVRYEEKEKRVYINDSQYFEGIEKEVWEYQIDGYQVLDKWLKGRKGGELSLEDIKHYCQIAAALEETIEIQRDIDNIYLDIEKDTI